MSEFKTGDEVMLLGVVKATGTPADGADYCVGVVGANFDSWVRADVVHPRPEHLKTARPKEWFWMSGDGKTRVMGDRSVEVTNAAHGWVSLKGVGGAAAILAECLMDVMNKAQGNATTGAFGADPKAVPVAPPEMLWEGDRERVHTDGSVAILVNGQWLPGEDGKHRNAILARYAEAVLLKRGVKP